MARSLVESRPVLLSYLYTTLLFNPFLMNTFRPGLGQAEHDLQLNIRPEVSFDQQVVSLLGYFQG